MLAEEAIRRVEDGDPADALPLAERAVQLAARDPRPAVKAMARRALGKAQFGLGDYRAAKASAEAARTLDESADPAAAEIGEDENLLGVSAFSLGETGQAVPILQSAVARLEATRGGDHEKTIQALNNLAAAIFGSGDFAAAEARTREALTRAERSLGIHRQTAVVLNSLSVRAGRDPERTAEAVELSERALDVACRSVGPDHPLAVSLAANVAIHRAKAGDPEGERLIRESVAAHEAAFGPDHPKLAFVLIALSNSTSDRGPPAVI